MKFTWVFLDENTGAIVDLIKLGLWGPWTDAVDAIEALVVEYGTEVPDDMGFVLAQIDTSLLSS